MKTRKSRSDKFLVNEDDIQMIENLAALGLNMDQIASVFNVSADTLYRRCKDGNTDLSASILKGRTRAVQKIAEKAFELALEGDVGLIKYILSCKGGWTEKSQIIHEGYTQNIQVNVSSELLKAMAKELIISMEAKDEK